MKISTYLRERGCERTTGAAANDAVIRTRGGLKISVDSSSLASASPVFDHLIDIRRRNGKLDRPIPILGVPSDAVVAFLRFLRSPSSPRCIRMEEMEMMDRYAMHLMVLSHVYRVRWLKDLCEVELSLRLTTDSVVDVLQLARQCDVPKLYLQCMKLLRKEFSSVEKTEAWLFLQNNDPWLELEILQFLDEQGMEMKRRRRKMREQKVYLQLAEAMECLQHICTEGCTDVGPCDHKPTKLCCTEGCTDVGPSDHKPTKLIKDLNSCPDYKTCSVLQNLIKHLASCRSTNRSSCAQCRRIWDLLRLHSSICQLTENCKVPLCKQFKQRVQMEGKGDDARWTLLAKKVLSVKVMYALAQRRKQDVADNRYEILRWNQ